jgi:hypothetical protein
MWWRRLKRPSTTRKRHFQRRYAVENMSRRTDTRLVIFTDCATPARELATPEVMLERVVLEEELIVEEVMTPEVVLLEEEGVDTIEGSGEVGREKNRISLRSDYHERD